MVQLIKWAFNIKPMYLYKIYGVAICQQHIESISDDQKTCTKYVSSCILLSIQDKDVPINKPLNMLIIYSLILRVAHKNGIYLF